MIDTDETGQKKLTELIRRRDTISWSEWEETFLEDMATRLTPYKSMSPKQKGIIGRLYDKFKGDDD